MAQPSRRSLRPIPGTEPAPRALFVDRWGTLLHLQQGPALPRFESRLFLPGVLDTLFRASHAGWRLYLIGNESSVAHGHSTDAEWSAFENAFDAHVRGHGVTIDRNYACLDHPQGVGAHKRDSVFCLPETGIFFHAAQNDGVVLERSWVIGDGSLELVAGSRAGCRVMGLESGMGVRDGELDIEPDASAPDLCTAIGMFLRSESYART